MGGVEWGLLVGRASPFRNGLTGAFNYSETGPTLMQRTIPVEDPIHSLFDLAEHAAREAPQVRAAYRHAMIVVGVVLFCIIVGDLASLYYAIVLNHLIFVGFGVLTLVVAYVFFALFSLHRADGVIARFFDKLRAIDALERVDADPKVPTGANPVERYARYVWRGDATLNPTFPGAMSASLGPRDWSVQGRVIRFDLAAERRGGLVYRLMGLGDPGNLLLVRYVPGELNPSIIDTFVSDVRTVTATGSSLPHRLVLLRGSSDPLPDELYAHVTRRPVRLRYRLARKEVPFQVVSERQDGNYDFTPYLINLP